MTTRERWAVAAALVWMLTALACIAVTVGIGVWVIRRDDSCVTDVPGYYVPDDPVEPIPTSTYLDPNADPDWDPNWVPDMPWND